LTSKGHASNAAKERQPKSQSSLGVIRQVSI
jgi:hypothetical protein